MNNTNYCIHVRNWLDKGRCHSINCTRRAFKADNHWCFTWKLVLSFQPQHEHIHALANLLFSCKIIILRLVGAYLHLFKCLVWYTTHTQVLWSLVSTLTVFLIQQSWVMNMIRC